MKRRRIRRDQCSRCLEHYDNCACDTVAAYQERKRMNENRPKPSQVDTNRRGAMPLAACFGRAEREIAAAIYIEACLARGDRWQPITPREFGETIRSLGRGEMGPAPSWVTLMAWGLVPDVPSLIENGWFEAAGTETRAVSPTDKFFEAIAKYVRPEEGA